jgi:hypothetical protein
MTRWTVIVVALIAAGCRPVSCGPAGASPYFPMSPDQRWEYRVHHLPTDRTWPVVVQSRGPQFVPSLARPAVIFDETYPDQTTPVGYFLSDGFLQSEIGLSYRAEGNLERMPIGIQPMRVMPMPPRAGATWSYGEQVFATTPSTAGVEIRWSGSVSSEALVAVPAGAFRDCLRVESVAVHHGPVGGARRLYRYVDWYAPNIGLIKSEYSTGSSGEISTRMELVHYGAADHHAAIAVQETTASSSSSHNDYGSVIASSSRRHRRLLSGGRAADAGRPGP